VERIVVLQNSAELLHIVAVRELGIHLG
jgi:hypothetical protein